MKNPFPPYKKDIHIMKPRRNWNQVVSYYDDESRYLEYTQGTKVTVLRILRYPYHLDDIKEGIKAHVDEYHFTVLSKKPERKLLLFRTTRIIEVSNTESFKRFIESEKSI